ncbi:MAG: ABC transporter ATP-binding protein [Alphaproteobacteria bacterium]|nr:ABC transporter ATP-binding protein [Alphaproteobacteria bacterium]
MAPLLSCRDVHAWYGAFHALKGVSLDIGPAERVAVFGHNGSGKSTLLKAAVGAISARTGTINFGGVPVEPGAVHRNVMLGIGLVPQGRNVFRELSVERNLLIAGLRHRNEDLSPIWTLFPVLKARRAQPAGTMSGGEQQMVAFGMALMTRPRMLFLDEPTTGLSPVLAGTVLATTRQVAEELGIGFLLIEQNVPRTLGIVERALILKTGRIVSDTPSAALAGQQDLWEWF